jgi:hypothetical protein
MWKLTAAFVALISLTGTAATGRLTGKWIIAFTFDDSTNIPGGSIDCTLAEDGERVTGACIGNTVPVVGELKDSVVTWRMRPVPGGLWDTSEGNAPAKFTGLIDEGATHLNGRFMIDGERGDFTAIRAK